MGMTKKMVFVYFSMDDWALNNVALLLGADMDADMSIETHMQYYKLLTLRKKKKL